VSNEEGRNMRVAILTTDTPHHRYFVNRLTAHCDIVDIMLVEGGLVPDVPLPAQEEIEREVFGTLGEQWMTGLKARMTHYVDINGEWNSPQLTLKDVDLGIVFGTGKLEPHVFNAPRLGCINVHRGMSQWYRGLDCDLWPIYEGQFERVGVTIHQVDERLDTGKIVAQWYIKLTRGMVLGSLRAAGTIEAVKLVQDLLTNQGRPVGSWTPGDYYSRMPADKREVTARRLQEYLRREDDDA
jgi:methionyl-tRNA formyltransferase